MSHEELFFLLTTKKDIAGANDSFLVSPLAQFHFQTHIHNTVWRDKKPICKRRILLSQCVDNRKFFVCRKNFGTSNFEIKHNPLCNRHNLPLHLVRLVACPEAEAGGKVAGEEMLLLDVGQKGLVDGLLVGGTSTGNLLLL